MRVFTPIVVLSAFLLMGCSGEMLGSRGSAGSMSDQDLNKELNLDIDFQKMDAEVASAETAMIEAEETLNELLDENGNLKVNLFSSNSVVTPQGFTPISTYLDKAFNKVIEAIQRVTGITDQARAKITDVMAKLDPSNPLHAPMIERLNQVLAKFDETVGRLDGILAMVIAKVDMISEKIDAYKAKLDMTNPLHLIALVAINEVTSSIDTFRNNLASL